VIESNLDILFEPLKMHNLILKNRLFMAPLGTGFDISRLTNFYAARARSDVGMITTGEMCVHSSGKANRGIELLLDSDDCINLLVPLVGAVHRAGSKIVAQLNHAGRYTPGRLLSIQSVAPSAVPSRYTGETPRELTSGEVDHLVIVFAEAALRARKAGFDGIEILASSGYLVSQFLSPLTNLRKDKYGGNPLNRTRFILSILSEIRSRVGNDFNICVKFDGEDGMKGGNTIDDAKFLAPLLVKGGADRLHMWAGWHESPRPMLPMTVPRGAFTHLSAQIKQVVRVPVSTVGRINDPYTAAEALGSGKADLVGLGRALICDPDFVRKTREGRLREIRRCVACCVCFDRIRAGEPITCIANPELGHEGEKKIQPTVRQKHVIIAGGGPSGLEAARVAALRGHRVTLFEEKSRIGGLLNLAIKPPHKNELKNLIDFYASQMDLLDIRLMLDHPLTREQLTMIKPDAVVLATGAIEVLPLIPGIERDHVFTAFQVLNKEAAVGSNVAVIGGGLIGVETAEYVMAKTRSVTLVEMGRSIAADMGNTLRWGMLARIRRKIRILTSARVVEINPHSVTIHRADKRIEELPTDTVIVATGLQRRNDLDAIMAETGIPYYRIGSCSKPGQIAGAIREGFEIGCIL